MATRINYLDLFSGIGGFAKGLHDAGVEIGNHYYSEIDKHCIGIYEKHFPEAVGLGDIKSITKETIKSKLYEESNQEPSDKNKEETNKQEKEQLSDKFEEKPNRENSQEPSNEHETKSSINRDNKSNTRDTIRPYTKPLDLISFGFPCQDLSIAGKRAGLEGNRSGLFFEAIRLIKELKPSYFIFENVKGLFSSSEGKDFKRCLQEIAGIGLYDCEWQLLNTSWFLPQNGERIYFVGHLRGRSRPKVFPITESNGKTIELQGQQDNTPQNKTQQGQQTNTITSRYGTAESNGAFIVECELQKKTKGNSQGSRVNTVHGNSTTILANSDGHGKTGLYAIPVITPDRVNKRQQGRRFKENNDPSFTLTSQDRHGVLLILEATKKEIEELELQKTFVLSSIDKTLITTISRNDFLREYESRRMESNKQRI